MRFQTYPDWFGQGLNTWVPEGLGTCPFDLLAELCCDKSATKRNLSLTLRKKPCTVYLKTETVEPGLIRTRKGHAIVSLFSGCPH